MHPTCTIARVPFLRGVACTFSERRIRVEARNDERQQVKTLAHELAHAMLHEHVENRALAELEAESVAFVVCANLGIASDDYSFGYVATWAGGGDEAIAAIKASGGRIQRAAEQILSTVEAASAFLAAWGRRYVQTSPTSPSWSTTTSSTPSTATESQTITG